MKKEYTIRIGLAEEEIYFNSILDDIELETIISFVKKVNSEVEKHQGIWLCVYGNDVYFDADKWLFIVKGTETVAEPIIEIWH